MHYCSHVEDAGVCCRGSILAGAHPMALSELPATEVKAARSKHALSRAAHQAQHMGAVHARDSRLRPEP